MMIKTFSTLILVFLASSLLACEVTVPHHVLVLGERPNIIPSIQHSACSDMTLTEISETLNSVEGKITSFQLAEILKNKNHTVNVSPKLIEVQHLRHLIREQLMLPPGVQLRSSEALNAPNYLTISPGDRIDVQCTGCLYGSQQPLNVIISGFDGSEKSLIVKADFKKMVRAYKVRGFHSAFSEVTSDSLSEVYVESIPHTDLVTDLAHLKFFKLNKPLKNGDLLKQSDLNALSLVRAGLKTEVIIENSLVRLKTQGISRSSGALGELVEVYHPQKKKSYQGRVIDINKVLVEL